MALSWVSLGCTSNSIVLQRAKSLARVSFSRVLKGIGVSFLRLQNDPSSNDDPEHKNRQHDARIPAICPRIEALHVVLEARQAVVKPCPPLLCHTPSASSKVCILAVRASICATASWSAALSQGTSLLWSTCCGFTLPSGCTSSGCPVTASGICCWSSCAKNPSPGESSAFHLWLIGLSARTRARAPVRGWMLCLRRTSLLVLKDVAESV